MAAPFLAAGAARHLVQKLEGALDRARVAIGEAEIGVDDADQIELGEMVSLGDELRADHDVDAPLLDVAQLVAQPVDRGDEIARHHQQARVGEQRRNLFREPLHAGAAGGEAVDRLAVRARRRVRHSEAAMVAHEPPPEAVIDQPGIAVRTGEAVAAGAAERERRIAAPVEKEQRLLPPFERERDLFRQPGAMNRPRGGPSRVRSIASTTGKVWPPKRSGRASRR